MSRDNYNYGAGRMGDNGKATHMIRDAARQIGIDPDDLSDRVHEKKGWYSYSELLELARAIKKEQGR